MEGANQSFTEMRSMMEGLQSKILELEPEYKELVTDFSNKKQQQTKIAQETGNQEKEHEKLKTLFATLEQKFGAGVGVADEDDKENIQK